MAVKILAAPPIRTFQGEPIPLNFSFISRLALSCHFEPSLEQASGLVACVQHCKGLTLDLSVSMEAYAACTCCSRVLLSTTCSCTGQTSSLCHAYRSDHMGFNVMQIFRLQVIASTDPKPVPGDWSGNGAPVRFSTRETREEGKGWFVIQEHLRRLQQVS